MARKLAYSGFSFLFGLLAASFFVLRLSVCIAAALLLLAVGIMIFMRPCKTEQAYRLAVCSFFAAMGIVYYSGYDAAVRLPICENEGKMLCSEAVICEAEHYSDSSFYSAKVCFPNGKKGRVGFYAYDSQALVKGDKAIISGILEIPDSSGFFDRQSYYASSDIFLICKNAELSEIRADDNNPFRYARNIRNDLADKIREYIRGEAAELTIGILFGDDTADISDITTENMHRAGIGHITSVSGMHMTVIAGMLNSVLIAISCSKRKRAVLVCMGAFVFALIADMEISVVRSLIMIVFVYAAQMVNRRNDTMTSLAAAAVIITAFSPMCIRSTSFLLSFSGVIGAAGIGPAVSKLIEDRLSVKLSAVTSPLLCSACAYAALFPAAALTFDEISFISAPANMLISPLVSFATITGAIACVLNFVPVIGIISIGFFRLSGAACSCIIAVSAQLSDMPCAVLPSRLPIVIPLLAIIGTATALTAIIICKRKYTAAAFMVSVLTATAMLAVYVHIPSDKNGIAVLSEGEGCAAVIYSENSSVVLDFIGSSSGAKAVKSYIAGTGKAEPQYIMTFRGGGKAVTAYERRFRNSPIISQGESAYGFISDKSIIDCCGCRVIPRKGYTLIDYEGTEIICIYSDCIVPEQCFDLAILSCKSDVEVAAEKYIIARTDYSGKADISRLYAVNQSDSYEIYNGEVLRENTYEWLR